MEIERPGVMASVEAAQLQDSLVNLLLQNPTLDANSNLVKDENLNKTFNDNLNYLAFLTKNQSLNIATREYLLNSTISLVNQLPYLKQREGKDWSLNGELSYSERMSDLIALHITSIFDLNPVTNYQQISEQKRTEIKNKIKVAYGLTGWDEKIWDGFTVLVNHKEEYRPFYYNFFEAFPNLFLMLREKKGVVYRFGDWYHPVNNPAGLADKAFPFGWWDGIGSIELGIHGVSHNISAYYEDNDRVGKFSIGGSRLIKLAAPLKEDWIKNGNCRDKHLSAIVFDLGGYDAWWCDSPYELWATLANVYLVNSKKGLEKALMGPNNLLDQFLFVLDIFSLETNTGRFYYFPVNDSWFSRDPNKQFEITNIPLTRNAKNQITSFTVDGKKYNFELNDEGNVLSYNIEGIVIPSGSGSISASPNPCIIPANQNTCSSVIFWNTQNAPEACVFEKESASVFDCEPFGNLSAFWITEQGITFELREKNDINSKLLSSVFVKGEKEIISQYNITVSKSGTGVGIVRSNPSGVNCGSDCSETYDQGTSVTLIAKPDSNSVFKNWSGDCSGTSKTCILTINANKTAIAMFDKKPIAQIDSISPNPVKKGTDIVFTGHGESDENETIDKYRWRLDSVTGKTRTCKEGEVQTCTLATNLLSPGKHTIYFRVGTKKLAGLLVEWSNWIGKEFTVESTTQPAVCGNNICESGETYLNCSQDCLPPAKPQCSDGTDNDNDNKIDHPGDPGCSSAQDNDEKDIVLPSDIPAAPSNVKAEVYGNKQGYLISWKDNSTNETSFTIERKVENNNWYYRGYARSNYTNYIDTGTNTLNNTFRVRACNKDKCSDYAESNPIDLYP